MRRKSASPTETKHIAGEFARKILTRPRGRAALVVALQGELGSGKTAFVKGFLKAAGVRKPIQSPTFVLMKRYPLPRREHTVFHIDAYRIKSTRELTPLCFKEIRSNPKHVLLIEWPERIAGALPGEKILIRFTHGKKERERIISL